MPRISIALLGQFRVMLDGAPVAEFKTNKVQALLAYLAVEANRAHDRESLAGLLWPNQPEDSARVNLRASLHRLRQALHDADESSFLLLTRETVQFNSESDHGLDVRTFLALITACATHHHDHIETCRPCHERLAQAVNLYQGDLLAGFTLSDSVAFDEWALVKREMLRRQALDALASLAAYHERRGEHESARRYALRQIELEPWRELAYRQLMRALALSGQRSEALAQYGKCRRMLADELGVEPEAETVALVVQIRAGELVPVRASPANNLPVSLTSFIGREREKVQVERLLTTTHLLTLTGPGGVGKTRLALQVAADVGRDFADGVWLVELAALTQPALVPQAAATVLNMCEEAQRPLLDTLGDCLSGKETLIVLDNCEHLIEACAELANSLLRVAPKLRIIATSREALRIDGETVYQVPSLPIPDAARANQIAVSDLARYESVRLFIDRARSIKTDVAITGANASAVAQICYRLEGIPLAIELAAARVNALPIEQIATRLDDRFRLLVGGSRTALPRQRTLRALIDWSYDLLSPKEQALLNRLSVFRGGCALEAVESVCACEQVPSYDVLNVLTQLVAKSLVRLDERTSEPRYLMLETMREYAQDKLEASGESQTAHCLHGGYFLKLAQDAEPQLAGAAQQEWLAHLEMEHDNLRMALEWSLRDEPLMGLQLSGALGPFWDARGYLAEGIETLECALSEASHAPQAWQTKALRWAGRLAERQGRYEQARELQTRGLTLCRELGEQPGLADCLEGFARIASGQGYADRAARLYGAAQGLRQKVGASQAGAQRAEFDRDVASVRAQLGEAFDAAWSAGRSMTREQAAAYALQGHDV